MFSRGSQNRASTKLALPRFCKSRTLFRYRRNPQPRGIASHTRYQSITTSVYVSRPLDTAVAGMRRTRNANSCEIRWDPSLFSSSPDCIDGIIKSARDIEQSACQEKKSNFQIDATPLPEPGFDFC